MKRSRLVALCSFVFVASGATIFACSGDDTGNDGGTDAKADQTAKDGGTDAGKDATLFGDSGNDATLGDGGSDATTDATSDDAADGAIDTDATDGGTTTDSGTTDSGMTDAGMATTFMVLRVGGDADAGADAALSNSSTQAYIEERNISDGSLVRVISLPVTMNGNNQPFTLQGNSTSEGSLTRSVDGQYVVVGGYATAPGTASVSGTAVDAGVPRVIARVDKSGNIDTTTELYAFNKKNIRGVATNDGTAFWASGAGNSSEGTQYVVLGSTGATTNLDTTLTNQRVVQIFGGQVYISSGSGAFKDISALGSGMPTTSGQTVTLLPGMPGDAGSPYGFAMLDQDGSVAGLDVLYVADDGSTTGGIHKWVFDGTNWTKIATFTDQSTTGFRGVTAYIDGSNIVVLGTTGDSTNPNTVVKYVDDGQNTSPTGTVIATAPANCAFRGIALAPQ